jgi:hexosaminidase
MAEIHLIPKPVKMQAMPGEFIFSAACKVAAKGEAAGIARRWVESLFPALNFNLDIYLSEETEPGTLHFMLDPGQSLLGSEGYRLEVLPEKIIISAFEPAGLFYGGQTLKQLMPDGIFGATNIRLDQFGIPCVKIEDRPRFTWRGAMLDVCRHFMPKQFVLKYIDLLAMHKMNSFHWHLTEDQGWRIEIKRYPRLTEVGAWRKETVIGAVGEETTDFKFDGILHGGFYSQEDIREVVEYARQRFINVVPEIEMPGHSQAAIAAYPELGNTSEKLDVWPLWGVNQHIFNVKESTFKFMQDVLDEVLQLFPSQFIHVGGDEAPKKEWRQSGDAQARIRELGLKNEEELQSYFIRRISEYLASKGRRLVGWDEILEGGLAPGATVMSWRGEQGGTTAANAGHDVIMAPLEYTYFNFTQKTGDLHDVSSFGIELPLRKVYEYDPIPFELDPLKAHHVLGAQAQLWTEYIPNEDWAEYQAFPRLCAFSEVVWSPNAGKDFDELKRRLKTHLRRLDAMQVQYNPLLE